MQNKSFLFKFALYFVARVLLNHMDQELHLLLFFMSIIKSADDQIPETVVCAKQEVTLSNS